MQPWIHCNLCMNISTSQMVVTSCGRVVCSTCMPRLSTSNCRQCQGPCMRTIPLTDKAPKEVLNLFTDISQQLKAVFKNYNFQESQKRSLLDFKEKRKEQISRMMLEFENKKNMEMDKVRQRKEFLVSLERREVDLRDRLNRMTSQQDSAMMGVGQGGDRQFGQGVFGGGVGQGVGVFSGGIQSHGLYDGGLGKHGGSGSTRQSLGRPGGNIGGGLNRSGGSLDRSCGGLSDGRMRNSPAQPGFLEMKTPAAWYHKQKDRRGEQKIVRNSPQQKLMELGSGRRMEEGTRNRGSPFFTSPPHPVMATPTRRHH